MKFSQPFSMRAVLCCALALLSCGPNIPKSLQSGFTMAANSFAFENFAHGYPDSQLDADALVRMFGKEGVCLANTTPCRLTPAARAWMRKANEAMAGGRCEGFAVMSSLMFSGDVKASDFEGTDARSLRLKGNGPLQKELAYWFATQLVSDVSASTTKALMPKDAMVFLANALKKGDEQYRIGVVRKSGNRITGGHSLTPIGYYSGDSDGQYFIRVYDNNHPDQERLISVDLRKNRWEFEASATPDQRSVLYFGDDSNQNPLYFAPVRNRLGTLPCKFCKKTAGSQLMSQGGVEVSVSDSSGNTTGLKDGELSVGAGGRVTPILTGDALSDEPAALLIDTPNNDLTIKVGGALDGDGGVPGNGALTACGQGFTVALAGLNIPVGTSDGLAVNKGGADVTYTNTSRTPLALSTSVTTADNKVIEVTTSVSGASETVSASIDPMTGDVDVTTSGSSGSEITVTVTKADEMTGEVVSGEVTVSGADGGSLSLDTGGWSADAGALSGTYDNGDGTAETVSDTCTDFTKNGTETGIDCGGGCPTRCALQAGCQSGADCASGSCSAAKTCVATECEDGVKNGAETDTDCGGGSCAACGTGKLCSADSDCGTSACVTGTCRTVYVSGGTLSGLPSGGELVLRNNGGDDLKLTSNGTFQFAKAVPGPYAVTVQSQPTFGSCLVTAGSGTATADVTGITIACTPLYAVGGTVTGLPAGRSVVLRNNGGDDLTLLGDGSFVFATPVASTYAVTVFTQPMNAECTVAGGSGTASASVGSVQVTCSTGVLYSQAFVEQQASSAQCTAYASWKAKLTGTFSAMTIRGTYDPVGVTCSDATAVNTFVAGLGGDAGVSVSCNAVLSDGGTRATHWNYCPELGFEEIFLDDAMGQGTPCAGTSCSEAVSGFAGIQPSGYALRPCATPPLFGGTFSWGGAGTLTCFDQSTDAGPPSQTIEFLFSR